MRRFLPLLFICFLPLTSHADALDFEQPITVTAAAKGVYLHLDSSGRRALAISAEVVAVVWEDNRSGKPAIYMACLVPGKTRSSALLPDGRKMNRYSCVWWVRLRKEQQ
jgi:hypothetical protein